MPQIFIRIELKVILGSDGAFGGNNDSSGSVLLPYSAKPATNG